MLQPQLKANYENFPCTLEEALFPAVFPKTTFPLELKMVLDMLYETPEVSRDTRPNSRRMLSFPPQVKKSPPFPAST